MNRKVTMKKILNMLGAIVLFATANASFGSGDENAVNTVRDFYERYFNYNYQKTPKIPAPEMEFSTAFKRDLKVNKELCAKYADGICGFAADGDPYTDAQDSDDNLDATKVKLKVTQEKNGLVIAKFNIFPGEGDLLTVVKFKMIQENGKWLVDEIIYSSGSSARRQIREENDYNLKHGPADLKLREKKQ